MRIIEKVMVSVFWGAFKYQWEIKKRLKKGKVRKLKGGFKGGNIFFLNDLPISDISFNGIF